MYDIIIIGGGPGGYVAAERAGGRGLSVLLIEKEHLGGVCLNCGCIPTKTLLNSAKTYAHALHGAGFGVHVEKASFSWPEMTAWKNEVVAKLRSGVAFLMKKNKVEVIQGEAELVDNRTVRLKDGKTFEARNLLLATGSSPLAPPIPGAQGNPKVVTSTELLDVPAVPRRLVVVGGGVVGVEFASLFQTLGVKVDVIEMLDEIVPFMDREHAPQLRKALAGVDFHLGCRVEKIEGGTVHFASSEGARSIEADLVLMSVGRRPNTAGLGLEKIGLDFGPRGVVVDDRQRTNVPGVFAVGDVTGRSLLAHSASRMGEVAVDAIVGGVASRMRYDAIPWAVYSLPEAAGVGLTEQEAKKKGYDVVVGQVPMRVSGRFLAENGVSAPGACKVVSDKATGLVLGVQMFGAGCSEQIWGAAAMLEAELRVHEARELVFPHPTVSEVIREALWEIPYEPVRHTTGVENA